MQMLHGKHLDLAPSPLTFSLGPFRWAAAPLQTRGAQSTVQTERQEGGGWKEKRAGRNIHMCFQLAQYIF